MFLFLNPLLAFGTVTQILIRSLWRVLFLRDRSFYFLWPVNYHQVDMKDDFVLLLSDLLSFHILENNVFVFVICYLVVLVVIRLGMSVLLMGVVHPAFSLYPVNITNYSFKKRKAMSPVMQFSQSGWFEFTVLKKRNKYTLM